MNRYLIIARVGDKFLHSNWIKGATPHFDIFLSYFGDTPNKYQEDCTYYEQRKGAKWPILYEIISSNLEWQKRYDAIWLPDDDLLIDADKINRMFALFTGLGLDLAQPALSIDSYFSHASLLQVQNSIARYCNFIEVMAPIFSNSALCKLKNTFNQSPSGWGLDNLWPHLLNNPEHNKIAIIDAISVTHTRPIGGDLYKLNPHLSPAMDIKKIIALYPHININPKSYKNKFKIYGHSITKKYNSILTATLKGKIQKLKNKMRSKKHSKFVS